jgi:hypothetical protein
LVGKIQNTLESWKFSNYYKGEKSSFSAGAWNCCPQKIRIRGADMGQRKLFIVMVRAELEDSIEGLEELSAICKRRLGSGEITNYVYNENEVLLHQEISGLRNL